MCFNEWRDAAPEALKRLHAGRLQIYIYMWMNSGAIQKWSYWGALRDFPTVSRRGTTCVLGSAGRMLWALALESSGIFKEKICVNDGVSVLASYLSLSASGVNKMNNIIFTARSQSREWRTCCVNSVLLRLCVRCCFLCVLKAPLTCVPSVNSSHTKNAHLHSITHNEGTKCTVPIGGVGF